MRTRTRNSNIELLRIIAMLLIVMNHYSSKGLGSDLAYSFNKYVATIARMGGKFGIVVFVMISGYYMSKSRITGRKIAILWGQIVFYAVSIYAAALMIKLGGDGDVFGDVDVGLSYTAVLRCLLPIGSGTYGFATDYVILMMVSPLLNLMLERLSKGQLMTCLVAATTIWSIIPTIIDISYDWSQGVWFMVLYLYAGYIRFHVRLDENWRRNIAIGILAYGIVIVGLVAAIYLDHATGSDVYKEYAYRFRDVNSPLMLLSGAELLLGFIKMQPFTSRAINAVGSATFGVFLIHENIYVRPVLWKRLLGLPDSVYDTPYLLPAMLESVVAVFVICALIDIIRQYTVERMYIHAIDRIHTAASDACTRYIDRVSGVIAWLLR